MQKGIHSRIKLIFYRRIFYNQHLTAVKKKIKGRFNDEFVNNVNLSAEKHQGLFPKRN